MTMREVGYRLDEIFKRNSAERSFQAALHGVKFDKKSSGSDGTTPLSKKQFDACKTALKRKMNDGKK